MGCARRQRPGSRPECLAYLYPLYVSLGADFNPGRATMNRVTLHIAGMSCSHCLNAVNGALSGIAGAHVTHVAMGRAEVEVSSSAVIDALVAGVEQAGYHVSAVATG
jgi:copper chaperone